MSRILVVDDVRALAEQYAYDLARVGGHDAVVVGSGREALEVLRRDTIDCVILDLEMPGMDGFDVLRKMTHEGLLVPVIVYTGTGNYDRCVQAIRLGAYGFVDKAEPMERVAQEIANALRRKELETEVRALREQAVEDTPLVGGSEAIRTLHDRIARIAPIPSPVLLLGESGSGKELVARELHRLGPDPSAPFLAVNCAALPESLLESELFGHERGAFTGAARSRKGAFEAAGTGTLFLDEVGELPLPAQAKLLRVLEEREVTRLGATRPVPVSARIVAATHRDLEEDIRAGRFRDDLFYRLNVHPLPIPPLRERLSDVPALVDHFVGTLCARFGMRTKSVAPEALERLSRHEWRRNNVRELRNVVERMIIAADGDRIEASDVPGEIGDSGGGSPLPDEGATFKARKAEAERQIVVEALERNDWHVTRTAEALGLADHASLLKIMRRHGIARER